MTIGERAKAILIERGWRQGPSFKPGSGLCMAEAIATAVMVPELLGPGVPREVVGLAVKRLGFRDTAEATDWNDARERTFTEVLERLDTWHEQEPTQTDDARPV